MRNHSTDIDESGEADRFARPAHRPDDRTGGAGGDRLWEIADVSSYLHIPVSSIYKMTARKASVHIPHIRIGGKLRFRRADIDRWLGLLTVSNLEALTKMRRKASQVNHGDHSQAQAP